MSSQKSIKKRRNKRYRKKLPISFDFFGSPRKGFVVNISESGLFINCSTLPKEGSLIDLSLISDHEKQIQLRGKVVWLRKGLIPQFEKEKPRGIGIDLLDLDEAYSDLIDHLESQSAQEASPSLESNLDVPVSYLNDALFLSDYCESLSKGGLHIISSHAVLPQQRLNIKLCIESSKKILNLYATCAHESEKPSSASKDQKAYFVEIESESIKKLSQFIATFNLRNTYEQHLKSITPSKGQLDVYLFPKILTDIGYNNYSGYLNLEFGSQNHEIAFYKGSLLEVRGPDSDESFFNFFIAHAELESQQKSRILKTYQLENPPVDHLCKDLLMREADLPNKMVISLWKKHQLNKVFSLFSKSFEGAFYFSPGLKSDAFHSNHSINLWKTIFVGLNRFYPNAIIQNILPLTFDTFQLAETQDIHPQYPVELLQKTKDVLSKKNPSFKSSDLSLFLMGYMAKAIKP